MISLERLALGAALCAALSGCFQPATPKTVEAIDITSDYHHRAQSGLFRPDREPVVLRRLEGQIGAPEEPFFEVACAFGSLWVQPTDQRALVLYVDESVFYSHLAIGSEAYCARIFDEWPTHPVH